MTRAAVAGVAGYQPAEPDGEPTLVPRVDGPPLRVWPPVPVAAPGAGFVARGRVQKLLQDEVRRLEGEGSG